MVSVLNNFFLILNSINLEIKGRTALHIACEYDNINVVEELIQASALPNIRAKDGSTALHVKN